MRRRNQRARDRETGRRNHAPGNRDSVEPENKIDIRPRFVALQRHFHLFFTNRDCAGRPFRPDGPRSGRQRGESVFPGSVRQSHLTPAFRAGDNQYARHGLMRHVQQGLLKHLVARIEQVQSRQPFRMIDDAVVVDGARDAPICQGVCEPFEDSGPFRFRAVAGHRHCPVIGRRGRTGRIQSARNSRLHGPAAQKAEPEAGENCREHRNGPKRDGLPGQEGRRGSPRALQGQTGPVGLPYRGQQTRRHCGACVDMCGEQDRQRGAVQGHTMLADRLAQHLQPHFDPF